MSAFRWTNIEALREAPDVYMRIVAREVAADARSFAPVDTGRLRNSIEVGGRDGYLVVFSTVEYAAYQEFGTRHLPARGFMAKALAKARARYG